MKLISSEEGEIVIQPKKILFYLFLKLESFADLLY